MINPKKVRHSERYFTYCARRDCFSPWLHLWISLGIWKRQVSAGIVFTPFCFGGRQRWDTVYVNKQTGMEGRLLLCAAPWLGLLSSSMPETTQRFLVIHKLTLVLGSSSTSVTMETWTHSASCKGMVPGSKPGAVPSYQPHLCSDRWGEISKYAFVWCPEALSVAGEGTFLSSGWGIPFQGGRLLLFTLLLKASGWIWPVGGPGRGWQGREEGNAGHVFPGLICGMEGNWGTHGGCTCSRRL